MPVVGAAGTGGLGSEQMARLARDLHKMGQSGRRAMVKRFAAVAQPLLSEARSRAGWSTRIPAALSVRGFASEATARVGVQLRASVAQAPHARAFEGFSGPTFRHPVFGNRNNWVPQATRPYASPAVQAKGNAARDAIVAAYEDAAREAGFR